MLGTLENGQVELSELTRFAHPLVELGGHFYWDILKLYTSILEGLKKAAESGVEIASIGIDTWGVDFALFDKQGELLGFPHSYRDPHTFDAMRKFAKKIPLEDVYMATGIQLMNFNSLFQFHALHRAHNVAFRQAAHILFMPDALSYLLTGNMVTEYTIASTSQALNPFTRTFDDRLLEVAGLSSAKFAPMVMPGTVVGTLSPAVCRATGMKPVPVVAVAGHDTASAVVAVPTEDRCSAYLSSGTWSLMGVELREPVVNSETYRMNFTNEGGIDGTIRFLKNICGMWLLERCRAEWNDGAPYETLIAESDKCEPFRYLLNPDDVSLANPESMLDAIRERCTLSGGSAPATRGEYVRCIFESLALRYRQVFDSLQNVAQHRIERLHVIGGGSRNRLLNQFTANSLGVPVIAGPSEATALGNVMVQARAQGEVETIDDIRATVRRSVETERFEPHDTEVWNEASRRYNFVNQQ
jgi:rhamnulokinase